MTDTTSKLKVLQELVTKYSDQYYNLGESEVSDAVFDELKLRLADMENESGITDKVSSLVGVAPRGEIVARPYPMLSLDNVFSSESLEKWLDKLPKGVPVAIEHKLDGMSLEVVYVDGKLSQATTRGDGTRGEIVTGHAKRLSGVPQTLPQPRGVGRTILLRGEVIVEYTDFRAANIIEKASGKDGYANPRNMVAGILRRNDSASVSDNKLKFICYDVVVEKDGKWESHAPYDFSTGFTDKLHRLVPEFIAPHDKSRDDLLTVLKRCEGNRANYDYEIDGLVIKCTDANDRIKLGTGNSYPHWAIAYKFPAQEGTSTLLDIDWQIGRTGVLTPVAKIKPVEVCGVTISSVSLYNPDEIKRLGLMYNAEVVVARMGDVIPKIVSVFPVQTETSDLVEIEELTECPGCGTELVRLETSLMCPNRHGCNEQIVQRLAHFGSRPGMDIKGMGEATVRTMVRFGITRPIDLYNPTTPFALNYLKEAIGETLYTKLMENIERSRVSPFFKVLRSVGIDDVGSITAEIIANKYNSFKELSEATVGDLSSMPYIGQITAQSIVQALTETPECYLPLDDVFEYQSRGKVDRDLEGMRIVVTGSRFGDLTRQEIEEDLKSRGAKVSGSVSKNTNILYVGTNPGKSKLDKATELGITVLTFG